MTSPTTPDFDISDTISDTESFFSSNSEVPLSQADMEPADTTNHLSQLETCVMSMGHLSLDERVAMLDRFKHEVSAAEQKTIKEKDEEQVFSSIEQLAVAYQKLNASGTYELNMRYFVQKVEQKLASSLPPQSVPQLKSGTGRFHFSLEEAAIASDSFDIFESLGPVSLYNNLQRQLVLRASFLAYGIAIGGRKRYVWDMGEIKRIVYWKANEGRGPDRVTIFFHEGRIERLQLAFQADPDLHRFVRRLESLTDQKAEVHIGS